MSGTADAVRALVALLRSGLDPRSSVVAWPDVVPADARRAVMRAARRVQLGDDVAAAVAVLGRHGAPLAAAFGAAAHGGDLPGALDAYAAAVERSERACAKAAAAAAGARLSGRLVAALPLVFVPLAPRGNLDPFGVALLVSGALLSLAGMWWIERIAPRPERLGDPVAEAADVTAALLAGGLSVPEALDVVAAGGGGLQRAARLVRLGAPWPDALARDPVLAALAEPLRRTLELGVPARAALAAEAARRRAAADSAFDGVVARATVLMTIPLALCVLPAYLLLGIAPYLRAV